MTASPCFVWCGKPVCATGGCQLVDDERFRSAQPRDLTVAPRVLAKDVSGNDTRFTQEELDGMIEALEATGRYDVVGRRW